MTALAGPAARPTTAVLHPQAAIALFADDREAVGLVELAISYRDILARHQLLATATTARMLTEMVGLPVRDRQLAGALAGGDVVAVIFLTAALGGSSHDPAIHHVLATCALRDIPLATNIATARAVLHAVMLMEPAPVSALPLDSRRLERDRPWSLANRRVPRRLDQRVPHR